MNWQSRRVPAYNHLNLKEEFKIFLPLFHGNGFYFLSSRDLKFKFFYTWPIHRIVFFCLYTTNALKKWPR